MRGAAAGFRWPHLIIHTRLFLPGKWAGAAIGPLILIHPDVCDDPGVLVHERTHVAQWWRFMLKMSPLWLPVGWFWYQTNLIFVMMPVLMLIVFYRVYKLLYHAQHEIEAFRAQLAFHRYNPNLAFEYAHTLATEYHFGIDFDMAYERLVKGTPLETVPTDHAAKTS